MEYERVLLELLGRISKLEERIDKLEHEKSVDIGDNIADIPNVSKKYRYLSDYLHNAGMASIKLSFSEIENILGFKLPNSAFAHRAFWANTTTHSIARSWMAVGFESTEVNLHNYYVVFEKKRRY